ncbi:MAG: BofC C-terminal domain-containing protein [Paenibacillaceae bacterium]
MGLKRAMDRIKRKIKRKKRLLLASLILLFMITGMLIGGVGVDARGNAGEVNHDIRNFCPTCTELAYVGLDDRDYLTLYDGHPEGGKIVRRLFRLDIESIENSLPEETMEQLMNGIQVSDDIEYSSVLSSFNDYAIGVVK